MPSDGSRSTNAGDDTTQLVGSVNPNISAPPGARICGVYIPKLVLVVGGSVFIVACAFIFGFAVPAPSQDPKPWDRVSSVIGWGYFWAWAVSFAPQIFINYTRKCVVGQSFDYVAMNVLGFTCYTIYTCGFYFFESVQDAYVARFHAKNNVDPNDVAFAMYALVMCLINSWQICVYDRGQQVLHKFTILGIALTVAGLLLWTVVLLFGVNTAVFFNTLDLMYGLSIVKLAVSLIKYLPQIYLNFKRKLTIGWNIWNVLLDISGGTLSVLQQLIDCGTTGDWSGIAGNPIKFALGTLSIFYDLIFITQHCVLYRENNRRVEELAHAADRSHHEDAA